MSNEWDEWADFYAEADLSLQYMDIGDVIESLIPRGSTVADMGCGAGGLVLHLAGRGFTTFGVDSSSAMLGKAREAAQNSGKPSADSPLWREHDMTTVDFGVPIHAIISIHSTLFSLVSVKDQIQFYKNAADRLADGGYLITESYIPHQTMLFPAKSLQVAQVDDAGVSLHASAVNLVTQAVTIQVMSFTKGGDQHMRTIRQRYLWPEEQRLMASMAGLEHVAEWEDWTRTRTNNKSTKTIQIFRKANHGA